QDYYPYCHLGAIFLLQRTDETARKQFERAIEILDKCPTKDDLMHLKAYAKTYYLQRKYCKAEVKCLEILKNTPKLAWSLSFYAGILYKLEKYPQAAAKLQEAIELDPSSKEKFCEISGFLLNQKACNDLAEKLKSDAETHLRDEKFLKA